MCLSTSGASDRDITVSIWGLGFGAAYIRDLTVHCKISGKTTRPQIARKQKNVHFCNSRTKKILFDYYVINLLQYGMTIPPLNEYLTKLRIK